MQQAQSLARSAGTSGSSRCTCWRRCCDPDQQVVRSLLTQLGVNPAQILKAAEEGLNALPKVTGGEPTHRPRAQPGPRRRAGRGRPDEGPVRLGRAPAARPGRRSRAGPRTLLDALGITEKEVLQALQKVRGGQRVTDQNPDDKYQALERYGRDLVELARKGKMDPVIGRDSEIRRVVQVLSPTDQEQPGPDRRAGRRQDGDRRGAGPADRLGRRPREPAEPQADRAGHGRAGRRHQVPRRVRGAAQGRAQGRHPVRGADHPVHRRAAPGRRRGQGRGRRWTPPTCSSRPWPAASCAASAPRRSTSSASTSRRTRRWSGGSSRSSSASRRSRTRSRSSAASRSGTRSTTRSRSRTRRW